MTEKREKGSKLGRLGPKDIAEEKRDNYKREPEFINIPFRQVIQLILITSGKSYFVNLVAHIGSINDYWMNYEIDGELGCPSCNYGRNGKYEENIQKNLLIGKIYFLCPVCDEFVFYTEKEIIELYNDQYISEDTLISVLGNDWEEKYLEDNYNEY